MDISLSASGLQVRRETAQKVGHLSVPASRGRALALSATVDMTLVFPLPLAAITNAETRDRGMGAQGYAPRDKRRTRMRELRKWGCGFSPPSADQGN